MAEAINRVKHWWQAVEVVRVFPGGQAVGNFSTWLARHQLGRKWLLDALIETPSRQGVEGKSSAKRFWQSDFSSRISFLKPAWRIWRPGVSKIAGKQVNQPRIFPRALTRGLDVADIPRLPVRLIEHGL